MKTIVFFLFSFGVLAAQTNHSATLNWVDTLNPAGATYNVYRVAGLCSGTPTFSKIATAVAVKTYVDPTVTPGNYCFEVTAQINAVESAPSNTAGAPVPAFPPANLTVQVAKLEVDVQSEALLADGVEF